MYLLLSIVKNTNRPVAVPENCMAACAVGNQSLAGKKQHSIFRAIGVYACGRRQLLVSLQRIGCRLTWPNNLSSLFMR
jgi:hypothetical protein